MAANIVELVAGNNIKMSGNPVTNSVTIDTTAPIPTSGTPLSVERGGTGVSNLGTNIDALKAALVEAINNSGGNTTIVGGELVVNRKIYITSSQQWTAPKTGVYVIRAGGGGAIGNFSGRFIAYGLSGFFCKKIINLTKGDILDISIGAGGVHYSNTANGKGGDTIVKKSNFTMIAHGGIVYSSYIEGTGSTNSIASSTIPITNFVLVEDVCGLPGMKISNTSSISTSYDTLPTPGKVSIEWME